jgi:hypothetical protein
MANPQNLKPFEKGHKFSKGYGRPKGSVSFAVRLRKALENTTMKVRDENGNEVIRDVYDQIIANLIAGACNTLNRDTLIYIREILDRDQGKSLPQIEQKASDEFVPNYDKVPDEILDMIYDNNQTNDGID